MPHSHNINDWIPVTVKEAKAKGYDLLDVIIVSGDAYVDHPSFGTAIIARILENEGLKVAIIPQPNWQDDLRDFIKFGKPNLFFAVTAGNMDSMINHYTANKRKRSDDAYTASGKAGNRPDYAVQVYTTILKKLYPETPVVIGGIEASLRRLTHFDYWSDSLKPSILADSKADLLIYGMAELPLIDLVRQLKHKEFSAITDLPQSAFLGTSVPIHSQFSDVIINSHSDQLADKKKFALSFKVIEEESNKIIQKRIIEPYADQFIVVNPAYPLISEKQLDKIYDLPFTRLPHPKYNDKGAIPAYEMIRHSINIHRGCFGGCSFCTISAHQGKFVSSRSEASVLREVEQISSMFDFKGHITDLGGPSANMYRMQGKNLEICKSCKKPSCIFPVICPNLDNDHTALLNLYIKSAKIKGVKKISIGSGIRYDLLQNPKSLPLTSASANYKYIKQVILQHTSGRLKVAPEHSSNELLKIMRKPAFRQYLDFSKLFKQINQEAGINQQLIPYLISSHPGCSIEDMATLAIELKKIGYKPEQVQDFTPTPMTLASVLFYTGFDPYTLQKVYTAKSYQEKLDQQRFLLWYKPENKEWIKLALTKKHRMDLYNELYDINPTNANHSKQSQSKNVQQHRNRHK